MNSNTAQPFSTTLFEIIIVCVTMTPLSQQVVKKCGLLKYKCKRCLTVMVFNHPSFLLLSPISGTCDNVCENGRFQVSKCRQAAAVILAVILTLICASYAYKFPLACKLDRTVCLQAITQLIYFIVALTIVITGNLKPKNAMEFQEEWYTVLTHNNFEYSPRDLLKRNFIYSVILVCMPPAAGVSSFMVSRHENYAIMKSLCLIFSLHLQLAAIFRHAMITKFIENLYKSFSGELKNSLEERELGALDGFEEKLHALRSHYSLLAGNTQFLAHNYTSKIFAWLVCTITILGINVYNLVLAFSEGFGSAADMAIPLETYTLILLILYVVKCVQDLSDVVS